MAQLRADSVANLGKAGQLLLALICGILISCTPNPRPARVSLSTYLADAETLIAERRFTEAVQILEKAANVYPDSSVPLMVTGQIYLAQHRWLLAEDAFNRSLARDLQNPIAIAGLAESLLNRGNLRRSQELWRQAIKLKSDLPGLFTGLGRTHLARLEFEAARQAFLEQLEQRADPEAQWFLAVIEAPLSLAGTHDYLRAIPSDASTGVLARRDYLLVTLAPFSQESDQVDIAQAAGIAMVQLQHWPLAIYLLDIAQDKYDQLPNPSRSNKAEMLSFLGHALAQAGSPALELFEQAQSLDPDSALPPYFYGIYLRQQQAYRAAEEQFKNAIELDPDNAAIYIELGQLKAEQGDFATAELYYEEATVVGEDDIQIQLSRVRFYANRGYNITETGIPLAEEIIEENENNAELYDLLGWMQFLTGEADAAEISIRRAIELDPAQVSAYYHLARLLEAETRFLEASAEYRRVIDWDSSGIFRDRALKDLQRLEQLTHN